MKMKKLISTALAVILLFGAIIAAFPVAASAAYVAENKDNGSIVELSGDEIKNYINNVYLKYNFSSTAEMLEYEKNYTVEDKEGKGLLYTVTSADKRYNIHINAYTGLMYYEDTLTGQILTSNPSDPAKIVSETARREFMSQLSVSFVESSNSTAGYDYNSIQWSALYNQITLSEIANGIRVNYTLGDTTTRFLLPGMITVERFEKYILGPMIENFESLFVEVCEEDAFTFTDNEEKYVQREFGCLNTSSKNGLKKYLDDANKIVMKLPSSNPNRNALTTARADINTILQAYSLKNPAEFKDSIRAELVLPQMYKDFPITEQGIAIYAYKTGAINTQKRQHSNIIKKYCFDYSMSMMFEDEEYCGYVDDSSQKPVFRCAIEYTFNDDGSLSVRLPANSITFDESVYTLRNIVLLKYFGAGSMTKDGSIFFPDGSGTVVEFDDFYNEKNGVSTALSVTSAVFGSDYCYSKITGAHRAQITMPVYGVMYTENASAKIQAALGKTSAKNGYFAILEEGASLANLAFTSGGSVHNYASVYATYNPYPSDEYDLSETISVGSLGTYSIVAESKYSGSYVTKIVMLNEADVGAALCGGKYYESTYSGMAKYYRDYLTKDGTLKAIKTEAADLPLYIEALGSMTITDKFLTFPIEKSIPLTSFEDVQSIYKQLSESSTYLQELVNKYTTMLNEELAKPKNEVDEIVVNDCNRMIAKYNALINKVDNVKNINFRLTGFANGGMYYTYPTKLKWERACGGKSGFKDLLSVSAEASAKDGFNFGVYPEFDFMYINNTASFDGISYKDTAAKMVDNRYASKQVYNSVLGEYESFFAMLISPDMLDELYTKFQKKFSKYDITKLSVSTLGSDLNSNFDEDNSINRDQARSELMALLKRMTEDDKYSLMTDAGNIYTVKYASHILNVAIDSSHFRYSSYTVPFLGMILHGSVSYAGSALNYSGAVNYDVLRSIENGAAPYYLLCYQNSSYLKDDEMLNKYFGIDYTNWYDEILQTYTTLNGAIGDLQEYTIVDHRTLITERVLDEDEKQANDNNLKKEIVDLLDEQIAAKVAEAYKTIRDDYAANGDKKVHVSVNVEALMNQFAAILGIEAGKLKLNADGTDTEFYAEVKGVAADYEARYPGDADAAKNIEVSVSDIVYSTNYKYFTDSNAFDEDYVYTEYTLDDNKVVMVTYQKGTSVVRFILNYNIYSVRVTLQDGKVYELDKYEFVKI